MPEAKVKAIGKYDGHSIKANKSVDVGFAFCYSELTNFIQLVQMLNENVTIFVKLPDDKPQKLGMFMLKQLNISSDGSAKIKFNTLTDYVEMDSFGYLTNEPGENLQILFKAEIEDEDNEDS